ncbi:unnamed protein product (macronuclear) [Paramecium tetraurelia]|uniref:CRC domain-containing protein n=1 Tax=Paramecium tetraurelia TaxID=5888 RepID=A0BY80_PARTE|nr:uncharacterized protein GSPATT00033350001 [Paramecium tetraurelia]CAK63497.1 unnamed protein product [Paramecium tetraurelia]|eukprot:XP_001430895.1 hypothetical protein (macronuclear) [Paramecium tetraurelia strain d4-2]
MFTRLQMINPGCDTIFNDQETNENLNFLTQPIKKIFLSNELTIPQIVIKSNFQQELICFMLELHKPNKSHSIIQNRNHSRSFNHNQQFRISLNYPQANLNLSPSIKNKGMYYYSIHLQPHTQYYNLNLNIIFEILQPNLFYLNQEHKPCNCRKSKCLKLYCDCFAVGKLCSSKCNCCGCFNNSSNLLERNSFIQKMIERNPQAFNQKVQEVESKMTHAKGCNCRKSGCQKKYCECYQMGIECSDNCKCDGCLNCSSNTLTKQQDTSQYSLNRKLNF